MDFLDFPGCILAGVSAAGFIGTMADNKSFKQMMRFAKKHLLNCYGKAKLGKSEQRAAQASSVSSCCEPFYSAVEEKAETQTWL